MKNILMLVSLCISLNLQAQGYIYNFQFPMTWEDMGESWSMTGIGYVPGEYDFQASAYKYYDGSWRFEYVDMMTGAESFMSEPLYPAGNELFAFTSFHPVETFNFYNHFTEEAYNFTVAPGTWQMTMDGEGLHLSPYAVPEPSTNAVFFSLGLILIVFGRRWTGMFQRLFGSRWLQLEFSFCSVGSYGRCGWMGRLRSQIRRRLSVKSDIVGSRRTGMVGHSTVKIGETMKSESEIGTNVIAEEDLFRLKKGQRPTRLQRKIWGFSWTMFLMGGAVGAVMGNAITMIFVRLGVADWMVTAFFPLFPLLAMIFLRVKKHNETACAGSLVGEKEKEKK